MHDRVFPGFVLGSSPFSDVAFGVAITCLLVLLATLIVRKRGWDGVSYANDLAWLRAGVYFCFCFALSAATGVLEAVWTGPAPSLDKLNAPANLILTTAFFAIVVHGYFIAWPRGTYVQDRKLYWTVVPFGIAWGISEAQLHLVSWALLEMLGLSKPWTALLQVGAMTLTFPWHVLYWDRYISPAHNILEWNGRKVLLAHLPNTLTACVFMAVVSEPKLYVAIEALSLVASTWAQRLPPPWKSEWHGRKILMEGGVRAAVLGLDARSLQPLGGISRADRGQ